MILVTLGTQDKEFSRLLKKIDKLIDAGMIKDKVIVQAGYTNYQSSNMEIFDMTSKEELEALMQEADLIITHGGVGSILGALSYQKKVIAVPRLKKYKEHTNDHQKQIVKKFEESSYILAAKDLSKLDKVIEKSKTFKPKKYQSNKDNFVALVDQYIMDTNHISWYHRDYQMITIAIFNVLLFCISQMILNFFFSSMVLFLGIIQLYLFLLISLSISYLFSMLLVFLLKIKRPARNVLLLTCFYIIELLFLMLSQKFCFSLIITKLFLSFLLVFIYHLLDKRG